MICDSMKTNKLIGMIQPKSIDNEDSLLPKHHQTGCLGKIITFIGGSRDPDAPTLFQIANVDSGEIRWIHGEEVTEIVSKYRTTIKKPSSFYEQIQQQQQQ